MHKARRPLKENGKQLAVLDDFHAVILLEGEAVANVGILGDGDIMLFQTIDEHQIARHDVIVLAFHLKIRLAADKEQYFVMIVRMQRRRPVLVIRLTVDFDICLNGFINGNQHDDPPLCCDE